MIRLRQIDRWRGPHPGGAAAGISTISYAPNASYGSLGVNYGDQQTSSTYGNSFVRPFLGGSGGGGSHYYGPPFNGGGGGGGGGGAILIVASNQIQLVGSIIAKGGNGFYIYNGGIAGGCGSGGGVRLVSTYIGGTGSINATGGVTGSPGQSYGGSGRIRFDCYQNSFGGVAINPATKQIALSVFL